jgi:hypothetical protein
MIIEKFTSETDRTIDTIAIGVFNHFKLDKQYQLKEGWEYYAFITPEKNWIRHSGKLTKEEKQWVIKQETNEQNRTR